LPFKVLLIDDSRTMREVLKVYLMGGKYDFIEAENATRALDLLRLMRIDLVIADINMPKMDGIRFVQTLRHSDLPQLRTIPVILVTSDKSDETRDRARGSDANAFLPKPLDAHALVDVVERLIRDRAP
jgi:two-component system chemotaxis response regulator CheY